jgi:hypothetical protein
MRENPVQEQFTRLRLSLRRGELLSSTVKAALETTLKLSALTLAGALALVPGAAALAQDTPIEPGYWESRNKMGIGPISLSDKVERKCLTPKDVDKFLDGPSNRHYACTYPERVIQDGKISMSGQCVHRKKGTKISLSLDGTYTPIAFDMKARLKWGMLVGSGAMSARRIGDTCPPGTGIKDDPDTANK